MAVVHGTNIDFQVPSLDLRFADRKDLIDTISGEDLITFTRNSVGTYVDANGVIQTATNGVPRFDHDPVTGESLGLLIEESRTNLVTYSEEFNSWNIYNATLNSNVQTAPDGTLTADKLIYSSNTSTHYIVGNTISISVGTVYTISAFVKKAEYPYVMLAANNIPGANPTFNLDTASVITNPNGSAQIEEYPGGWYRIWANFTADRTGTNHTIRFCSDTGSQSGILGDDVSGFYIWGAQLEAGTFPTSYIPTSGSTVTRAADVASITGSNFSSWYNQSEGTLLTDMLNTNSKFQFPWTISANGSASSNISPRMQSTSPRMRILFNFNGVSSVTGAIDDNFTTGKFVLGYSGLDATSTSLYYSANGGTVISNTFTNVVSSNDRIVFGYYYNNINSGYYNGHISRLTYYPTRLSNSLLEKLTK